MGVGGDEERGVGGEGGGRVRQGRRCWGWGWGKEGDEAGGVGGGVGGVGGEKGVKKEQDGIALDLFLTRDFLVGLCEREELILKYIRGWKTLANQDCSGPIPLRPLVICKERGARQCSRQVAAKVLSPRSSTGHSHPYRPRRQRATITSLASGITTIHSCLQNSHLCYRG